ncbi:hypothetical protein CLIM01_10651 [Colletotrichum limetticola]|uniref:BTB domain-containing protein n=1 Tax=Colletotrichum limetticola TaxID=1209924 RepID=A0ABQ9PLZ9_9PEZI|nr:hypothetical protein CLIM01_10651 [Colletotrichum limetticola]
MIRLGRFEPMVSGYEARGRGGEAWQLTQDTFEAHRANMTLAAPSIAPWIERMISGYEARGRGDEAWQLTQDTFEAHRANMPLTVPSITPWIERMVSGYESRCLVDALRICRDLSLKYLRLPAFNLADSEISTLLDLISRELPDQLRESIAGHLRALPSDASITLETGEPFHVRKEVLQFWSTYFSGAFRHDWGKEITFSEEIISEQSWAAVLDFMYNGKYTVPDDEEQAWGDWQAADYLGILAVLTKLQEAAWSRAGK